MSALPERSLLSVEEYLQLERDSIETRYEYIDGHVRMMSGGTLDHATIGANVMSILRNLLRGGSCRAFNSDARVRLSKRRFVYPDVSVSCNERDRGQVDEIQSPLLVVEVLSQSTEGYDRGRKFAYYRECPTIQECVFIDTQHPLVEVYRRERDMLWLLHAFGPGDDVELESLGVRFSVTDVYEDVTLPPEEDDGSE
ncbi:MAG: Uma2 family endonuclease [Chloroflexota bacterium]|nr:Uma2 family endonuclease [Chloroflexota bacterium]